MRTTGKDKSRLIQAAQLLADQLRQSDHGKSFRIRKKIKPYRPYTDGWAVEIGDLGEKQPYINLWLDCFTGYAMPKLFACLFTFKRERILKVTKKVSKRLFPIKTITVDDLSKQGKVALKKRLGSTLLGRPILEKYEKGETFFGIYDSAKKNTEATTRRFCNLAANFLISVAECLPTARGRIFQRDDYPRFENRRLVKAHLQRERSSFLATQCKERDGYKCRVCRKTFTQTYGRELGDACLEAHHLRPLASLKGRVRTNLEDLITVCANCHRALHRMSDPGNFTKLRKIIS